MKHLADAESGFVVLNISPDFCEVDGAVIPFDLVRDLTPERASYSKDVFSRGAKVLKVGSVVQGVEGNAGAGVFSAVAEETGDVEMVEGSQMLFVNGKAAVHHGHHVLMNSKSNP